jgi:hypothetical protein
MNERGKRRIRPLYIDDATYSIVALGNGCLAICQRQQSRERRDWNGCSKRALRLFGFTHNYLLFVMPAISQQASGLFQFSFTLNASINAFRRFGVYVRVSPFLHSPYVCHKQKFSSTYKLDIFIHNWDVRQYQWSCRIKCSR